METPSYLPVLRVTLALLGVVAFVVGLGAWVGYQLGFDAGQDECAGAVMRVK